MADLTMSLTVGRYVTAPPAAVWSVITDLEGTTAHLPGVVSIERLSADGPGAYAVGTRWRETRRMFGQDAAEVMEVVSVDPERRAEMRAEHHGTRYDTGFELIPAGNGARPDATLLRFHFRAVPSADAPTTWRAKAGRAVGGLMAPLGAAATRSAMQKELAHLALLAERRAATA